MTRFFVMEYDEDAQELVALEPEADAAAAMANRRRRLNASQGRHRSIIVFTAASMDDLRTSHSRYFQTQGERPAATQVTTAQVVESVSEARTKAASLERALAHA